MENKLPIYKIKVDPSKKSAGVFAVSLVDQPAIEVDWIKLNKEILFFENIDQQMLYGPLLIPGKQIFRRHPETGEEFYIVFEADVIEIIARKYNKEKLTDQFNIMHSDKKVEAYLAENWIVKEPDASQAYGFNLPVGTWFGGVKVEDEKFWKSEVRTEMVKGFSVEIRADLELMDFSKMISQEIDKYNEQKQINLMEVKTKDGKVLVIDGELVAGSTITIDGEVASPGEYELEDGTRVIVGEGGAIADIITMKEDDKEQKLALDPAEVMTAIQPALDEFRSLIAELMSRVDVLEQHEAEYPDAEEFKKEVEDIKSQVEKLASSAGAPSIVSKTDAKAKPKSDNQLLEKFSRISKFR